MWQYPKKYVGPFTWYQGNEKYECYVTRFGYRGGSRFKTVLLTKNGTHLQTENFTSLRRAMKFCLFFLNKEYL